MKTRQSEPDASARDAADTGLSLADAPGYEGKFLSAGASKHQIQFLST